MFDPIKASEEIKSSYIDYITTSFDLADHTYAREFRTELEKEGAIARGPFLDIGGAYETGRTLAELVKDGSISQLFYELEPIPEEKKELKLERPLYRHQETALLKASAGESLVVTTGTGSGKTECFLLPIINHLLREKENSSLSFGVRAIIIYPMNALANDQIKRMRAILQAFPSITFGVYNGNTQHTQSKALSEFHSTYKKEDGTPLDPLENEIISREEMQRTPPNILITNYSMLEYMMLRPKDDAVFSGAKLKFIVLDEAHIYKGATGMETSLLMRRLRARISEPNSVQYLLTSATLGGPESNKEILDFASKLCGVPFYESGIIRSSEKKPQMLDMIDFPIALFCELHQGKESIENVLSRYNADYAPNASDEEKLYQLFLRAKLFHELRKVATEPITVSELRSALSKICQVSYEQVVAFIEACARAEHDGANLIKPRYHFFVRAMEGAYITIANPKHIFLQRKLEYTEVIGGAPLAVFEAAVCTDCGRIAIVGREEAGYLKQSARQGEDDNAEYYYICEEADGDLLDQEEKEGNEAEDYSVCPICGALSTEADLRFKSPCGHNSQELIRLRKVKKEPRGGMCPSCGFGTFRRFYLGSEAATAVLGTELFEQLPCEEIEAVPENASGKMKQSVFTRSLQQHTVKRRKVRQFLCFSDSRSEAAFFASYMERSYQEFLRRRGIWHIAEKYRALGRESVSVAEFVNDLTRYYDDKRCFVEWDSQDKQDLGLLTSVSNGNAWVAILNEMFNARRGTSLVAMGVLSFEYKTHITRHNAAGLLIQDLRKVLGEGGS